MWSVSLPAWLIAGLLVPVAWNAWDGLSDRRAAREEAAMHLTRAEAALEEGDFARAEVAFGAAHRLRPLDPELQRQQMLARVRQAAEALGDDVAAVAYALDATADREGPAHHVARGRLALRDGDVDGAREHFEAAGDHVHAFLALAELHHAAGRKLEALDAYEAALRVAPRNLRVLNDLGVRYVGLGRHDEAVAVLQTALGVKDNGATRLNIGSALADLDRAPEAIEHLRRAAELVPGSAQVHRRLGEVLLQAGKLAEAEQSLLRSLALQQDLPTLLRLGALYEAGKLPDKAVAAYRKVVTLAGADPAQAQLVASAHARLAALALASPAPASP